jgi:hypothetical protein
MIYDRKKVLFALPAGQNFDHYFLLKTFSNSEISLAL